LAAKLLQPAWSLWKASNDLPRPGMTWTVGPTGVAAHPANAASIQTEIEVWAKEMPGIFTLFNSQS
jgi:hypothetical protein